MPKRRTEVEIQTALALVEAGSSHLEAAALAGVPVTTLRNWLYRGPPRILDQEELCPICGASHDFHLADPSTYAYLLGVYLGDGHLSHHSGRTFSFRVALDSAYPGIIEEVAATIDAVRGRPPWTGYEDGTRVARLVSYWRQWPCWLPQHGPGRKHHRRISLEPWQLEHVNSQPGRFLRGLIHTDGWRGLNRVRVKSRDYAYPRYQFSNRSEDIRRLFTDACDLLGIEWRPWGRFHISVARHASVAQLDAFVGPKT